MAVIISSHKSTVAMMNSIHSLLSENHPYTLFMASLLMAPWTEPEYENSASETSARVRGSERLPVRWRAVLVVPERQRPQGSHQSAEKRSQFWTYSLAMRLTQLATRTRAPAIPITS